MKSKDTRARSALQRVGNRGRERRLTRNDAIMAYAMDRLLFRLGRSPQAREFFLKGGLLVANLVPVPHRFTRDIDLLRRHGPSDVDELRERFREIAMVPADDGLIFPPDGVRATQATRDVEGYDGVRVMVRAFLGGTEIDVPIDIGFGDAVVPPAERLALVAFLDGDPPARVYAYEVGPVLAEKVETLLSKFPVIEQLVEETQEGKLKWGAADGYAPMLASEAEIRAVFMAHRGGWVLRLTSFRDKRYEEDSLSYVNGVLLEIGKEPSGSAWRAFPESRPTWQLLSAVQYKITDTQGFLDDILGKKDDEFPF